MDEFNASCAGQSRQSRIDYLGVIESINAVSIVERPYKPFSVELEAQRRDHYVSD